MSQSRRHDDHDDDDIGKGDEEKGIPTTTTAIIASAPPLQEEGREVSNRKQVVVALNSSQASEADSSSSGDSKKNRFEDTTEEEKRQHVLDSVEEDDRKPSATIEATLQPSPLSNNHNNMVAATATAAAAATPPPPPPPPPLVMISAHERLARKLQQQQMNESSQAKTTPRNTRHPSPSPPSLISTPQYSSPPPTAAAAARSTTTGAGIMPGDDLVGRPIQATTCLNNKSPSPPQGVGGGELHMMSQQPGAYSGVPGRGCRRNEKMQLVSHVGGSLASTGTQLRDNNMEDRGLQAGSNSSNHLVEVGSCGEDNAGVAPENGQQTNSSTPLGCIGTTEQNNATENLIEAFLVESKQFGYDIDQNTLPTTPTPPTLLQQAAAAAGGEFVDAVAVDTTAEAQNQKTWKRKVLGITIAIIVVLIIVVVVVSVRVPTGVNNNNNSSSSGAGDDEKNNTQILVVVKEDENNISQVLLEKAQTTLGEIEKRVLERVNDFITPTKTLLKVLHGFVESGAFPHGLDAGRDRDALLSLLYSLRNDYQVDMIYYGSEEGMFVGYVCFGLACRYGYGDGQYKEPANSYPIDDPHMQKYYKSCVDSFNGVARNCTHQVGAPYIQCVDNCSLVLCPGDEEESQQPPCGEDDGTSCAKQTQKKWCSQYEVRLVTETDSIGYVPLTSHCHNEDGVFSEEIGKVVRFDGSIGNCTYHDGITLVNRSESLAGDYAYCQGKGTVCSDVFVGGYQSIDYDPRYRPWYMQTKQLQAPNWSPAYPFFTFLDIGITYSSPYYEMDKQQQKKIFKGIFSIDVRFQLISQFLQEAYPEDDSNVMVAIYEVSEPHYLVATSTGSPPAKRVMRLDPSKPCPDDYDPSLHDCTAVRRTMDELEQNSYDGDQMLHDSYKIQKDLNHPTNYLQSNVVGENGFNRVYLSLSSSYLSGDNLEWIVLVIAPVE